MLSKSRYTRGLNCPKSLWLYAHKREMQRISESTQAIFARGTSVGELAQHYFPNGKMAVLEDFPGYTSAKRTQEFIQQGIETIYEATFIYQNTLVAVDILLKLKGKWYMFEVKSTNSVKPEHIKDVAIQYFVVTGSGPELEDAFLMHFNRDYVRHGDLEIDKLFLPENVREPILQLQADIPGNIKSLLQTLKEPEPEIAMGKQCISPYECDFTNYCLELWPQEKETVELSNKAEVMQNEIREFVANVEYPLCYLDFETLMPGVPMFDESRPYQQIPFQYSLHVQNEKDGEIRHCSYLAENNLNIDPRKNLIPQLIWETQNAKTIFVYNIAFERTRINEMIRDFTRYASELEHINERLVDLIIPFRKGYYSMESMEGSSSIKKVLPALCPELSYEELEIRDGMTASNTFLDMYYCDDRERVSQTREHLLTYCHLDTLAMVKIFEVLKKV